jgi:stress-induced morphogen
MKKNLAATIKEKIEKSLNLTNVEVLNNSYLHNHHSSSPKNGNSHFQIIISSHEMKGLSRIQIHKKIYSELKLEMSSYIHSLEITLKN